MNAPLSKSLLGCAIVYRTYSIHQSTVKVTSTDKLSMDSTHTEKYNKLSMDSSDSTHTEKYK